jgi:putative ABC transport system permease protein
MSLFKIAWRSIQQRALSSWLTALSMALGVALVVTVLVIMNTVEETFTRNAQGFDLIVGAKGGALQLVLNTVYHLSTPVENVPYDFYLQFKRGTSEQMIEAAGMLGGGAGYALLPRQPRGRFASAVDVAIPYCLGDSYQDFRVVGTEPSLFEIDYAPGQYYQFAEGRNFKTENFFEAVIGSRVARETGLKLGDKFNSTHGIGPEGHVHKDTSFEVVGILEPTGTPNDRAVFVNIEGFYLLDGHAFDPSIRETGNLTQPGLENELSSFVPQGGHASPQALPIDKREVTAILIRTDPHNPIAAISLNKYINKNPTAQAVAPTRIIFQLFENIVGNLRSLLLLLTCLIVVVAGIGIMVSIYNSMSDRRRDIAVMRALGARRSTVMTVILLESIGLSLGGGLAGFILGHAAIGVLSGLMVEYTGVYLGFFSFVRWEALLLPGLVVLSTLAGYLPAMSAYKTDVSRSLQANP